MPVLRIVQQSQADVRNDSPTGILHLAIPISKHIPHQVSMEMVVVICDQFTIFELPTAIANPCSNLRSEPFAERCGNRWSYPVKKVGTANRSANERTCTALKTDEPVAVPRRCHEYSLVVSRLYRLQHLFDISVQLQPDTVLRCRLYISFCLQCAAHTCYCHN